MAQHELLYASLEAAEYSRGANIVSGFPTPTGLKLSQNESLAPGVSRPAEGELGRRQGNQAHAKGPHAPHILPVRIGDVPR